MNDQVEKIARHMSRTPVNTRTLRSQFRIGRNDLCYCGSGRKFKVCCFSKHVEGVAGTTQETERALKKAQAYLQKQLKKERDKDDS